MYIYGNKLQSVPIYSINMRALIGISYNVVPIDSSGHLMSSLFTMVISTSSLTSCSLITSCLVAGGTPS